MSEPPVLVCPECGAPRAADGTPSCTCAHRASEAHRESRTAEAAAAEDFDPVRIRPFVEVGEEPADPAGEPEQLAPAGDLSATALVPVDAGPATREEPRVPSPADSAPHGRGRRNLIVAGAGAAVAVLVTGGFVGGLFTYDGPSRDGSVAGGVRAGVPEAPPSSSAPSVTASSPTATSTRSSAPPSSSPTAESSDSASPTGTTTPTGAPSSAAATATVGPGPTAPSGRPPVLGLGDQGPEVVELQLRLRQVGVYAGEADGDFDQQVENAVRTYQVSRFVVEDEPGVYGTATRAALESETSQP
ncbi:peptidoglycan-binding domain-containing protein [Streptomyces sp. NPDC097941]|uniref:peptidoglycan-binding domain-containing protein n=1 Tax=Streptomyces sp. NPDC097941 TaxID=3155685 RepID=UPI00331DE573